MSSEAIIVFDGVCHLCSAWVRFLLRFDRRGTYKFASMQSESGRRLMAEQEIDPDDPSTFLLLRDGVAQTDSSAVISVLTGLGGLWKIFGALCIVPRVLRDPVYRWIARNRYRLLGKREQCLMPQEGQRARFLP
jgi:predicted DCC family thiol-disulfide oxidoreductase YuxK